MANHQAIREVVEAFNAGKIQLTIVIDHEVEDVHVEERKFRISSSPTFDIEIEAQDRKQTGADYVPRLILTATEGDRTTTMSF